jgi:hypothetical protein
MLCAKSLLLELAQMSERAETFVKMNGGGPGKRLLETLEFKRAEERGRRQRQEREVRAKAKKEQEKAAHWEIIAEELGGVMVGGFAKMEHKGVAFMRPADGLYVDKTEHDLREEKLIQRTRLDLIESKAAESNSVSGGANTAKHPDSNSSSPSFSGHPSSVFSSDKQSEAGSSRPPSPSPSTSSLTSLLSTASKSELNHYVNQQGYHLFFVQDKGWLVTSPGTTKYNRRAISTPLSAYYQLEKREKGTQNAPFLAKDTCELESSDEPDIEEADGKDWIATNPELMVQNVQVSIRVAPPSSE